MSDDPRLLALSGSTDPDLLARHGSTDPRLLALPGSTDPRLVALSGSTDPRLVALREASEPVTEKVPVARQTRPSRSDLEALKDGAAMMTKAGNRVAAMALLWSAVAIDPTDLAAHRRIAATLAHGGDIDGAAEEYARYIEFMLPLGEVGRATLELAYGARMLGGGHPALRDAAEKIVTAVRQIVPATNVAIAPAASSIAPAAPSVARAAPSIAPAVSPVARAVLPVAPAAPTIAPAVSAPIPQAASASGPAIAEVAVPLPAPRLLPKVPFRFCVHADGDRHWMQLEGGTAELVPAALRVVDPSENVIETRLCIPLAPGDKGHAPAADRDARGVAWAVVGITNEIVSAIDAGRPSPYGFQAKVGDDWLSLDLVDTGCRLGRTRATHAAS
jgi:hypothetical protein